MLHFIYFVHITPWAWPVTSLTFDLLTFQWYREFLLPRTTRRYRIWTFLLFPFLVISTEINWHCDLWHFDLLLYHTWHAYFNRVWNSVDSCVLLCNYSCLSTLCRHDLDVFWSSKFSTRVASYSCNFTTKFDKKLIRTSHRYEITIAFDRSADGGVPLGRSA